jgi:hypothetical protein
VIAVPGRLKNHDRWRLASGRQLWALNRLGRLRVVDDGAPISSHEAKVLIADLFERRDPTDERAAVSASPHYGPR